MSPFLALVRWEVRHLVRTGTARAALALLFGSGLIALWSTDREITRQEREIAHLPSYHAAQMERIAAQFPKGEHAGYIAYYAFAPTTHPPAPLARFSLGLRDVTPTTVWVRLLGLEAQLYESGIGNPALQAIGTFDLAFVLCALAPLVLLVLVHDALTREREQGVLPLALVQAGGVLRLFGARIVVRSGAVGVVCVALFAIGLAWHRIPPDTASSAWFTDALLHLACWAAAGAVIAAATRSVSASLAAALSAWTAAVVLLPALLNLVVVALYPVPEGLELTVRQRQETHSGWDRPKEDTFLNFFITYPEWADTPPVTTRFAWKWYYAMHQVGDDSVAAESKAFRDNLLARAALLERLAWAVPPVYAQLLLSRRAGTDLDAHLAYLERVRAFHGSLKQFYYPLVFAEAQLTPADFDRLPRFTASGSSASPGSLRERLPLLLLATGFFALAVRIARRTRA
jgi:ABC-2 type transport system permease protein